MPRAGFLDHRGHLKLGDFGLARAGVTSPFRGAHSVCGTPEYMAPDVRSRRFEVLRGLHAIFMNRLRKRRSWVVSLSILRPFGPFPVNTMLRAGSSAEAVGLRHGRRLVGSGRLLLRTVNRSAGVVHVGSKKAL